MKTLTDKMRAVADVHIDISNGALPAKYVAQGFRPGRNVIKFCKGEYGACGGTAAQVPETCEASAPIWGQVVPKTGPVGEVFAVCYAESSQPADLWITRWNWDPRDEGFWVRCLNGCCTAKRKA